MTQHMSAASPADARGGAPEAVANATDFISPADYVEELDAAGYPVLAHFRGGVVLGVYRMNPANEGEDFDCERMLAAEGRKPRNGTSEREAFFRAVGEYCVATGRLDPPRRAAQ